VAPRKRGKPGKYHVTTVIVAQNFVHIFSKLLYKIVLIYFQSYFTCMYTSAVMPNFTL